MLRARVRIRNDGDTPVTLRSVSSLLLGALPSPDVLDADRARNDWLAECRWHAEELRESVPDVGRAFHGHDGRAGVRLAGRGSWPTDGHLAMGALTDRTDWRCWLWQIESAASWLWEAGEADHHTYLSLGGPTADDHQWRQVLSPGAEFVSDTVALALGDGFEGALTALTDYRRLDPPPAPRPRPAPRRLQRLHEHPHGRPDHREAAAADRRGGRGGRGVLLRRRRVVRRRGRGRGRGGRHGHGRGRRRRLVGQCRRLAAVGAALPRPGWPPRRARPDPGARMVPALWLEPEVVGVRSPLATELPDEAFLCHEGGVRVTEQGRHQLDLTHPAARAHLDRTVDRLVGEWGVGYLKLDYNITTSAPGLLDHTRAWLSWLSAVLDRHPDLVVENCGSGGLRMDGASLAVAQLQSTTSRTPCATRPSRPPPRHPRACPSRGPCGRTRNRGSRTRRSPSPSARRCWGGFISPGISTA